jgi:hypothetical protein
LLRRARRPDDGDFLALFLQFSIKHFEILPAMRLLQVGNDDLLHLQHGLHHAS